MHRSFSFLPEYIMFEARVGEKELSPPRRRRVLLRLRVVGYGQRRRKFKGALRFVRGERVFLPLLVKIRSRFCSRQNFGVSEERFSAVSASASFQANFLVKVPQLPAPCTFPSAVRGSSRILLLPELWACKGFEEE